MAEEHQGYSSPPTPQEGRRKDRAGIGEILRQSREKRGLSYSELSEKIRFSPSAIQALEKEDWESLPSPVIVRGFIRSYAGVLGLDGEELVGRYKEIEPIETPIPGSKKGKAKKKGIFLGFLIVIFIFFLALAGYFWKGPSLRSLVSSESGEKSKDIQEEELQQEGAHSNPEPPQRPKEAAGTQEAEQEEEREDEGRIPVSGEQTSSVYEPPPVSGTSFKEKKPLREEKAEKIEASASMHTSLKRPEAVASGLSNVEEQRLEATIEERTWLRIAVDDKEPREYIFYPGSVPEWKAKERFELVIGNAGGIMLELNGEELPRLGETGEVVHLKLPAEEE